MMSLFVSAYDEKNKRVVVEFVSIATVYSNQFAILLDEVRNILSDNNIGIFKTCFFLALMIPMQCLAGLSMNSVQSHSHTPTHINIYLGMLLLHVQNFIWQVNCIPTLQQVSSVILLQIIHLQLYVEFPFIEIHCII